MAYSMMQKIEVMNEEEGRGMMAVWPDIIEAVTDATKELNIPDVAKWLEKVLEYNVLGGKKIRALVLIDTYKLLVPDNHLTEDNIRLARILAWCVELMQAHFLIAYDVINRSLIRRGQSCWYRYNNINEAAINDSILLKSLMFYIIRKHFKGRECYIDLLETFQDIIFKTTIGESLELLSTNFGKKPNLDVFTMDRYNSIIEYKTAHYTCVLPIIAAMHLAGIKDPEMFRQAITILLEIGHLYQVQDDYLACFGDSKIIVKDNVGIEKGKCTWLIVTALQRASPEQRKNLEECFGVSDQEKTKCVRQLFNDLGLLDDYSVYKQKMYNQLNANIQQISCNLPRDIFKNLLERLYHRPS